MFEQTRQDVRTYLAALRTPGVLRVTASQLLARLPLGMLTVATLLHVHGVTGSYGKAGVVVGCMTLSEAVVAPLTGRLVGSILPRVVLLTAGTIHALSLVSLGLMDGRMPALMVLAALAGGSVPPVMPAVRALYPRLVPQQDVQVLFGLDTTAQELIWIVGPVLATLLAVSYSTSVALCAAGAITLAGVAWFVSASHLSPVASTRPRSHLGAVLLHRSMVLAMLASAAVVASFMSLEVGVVNTYQGHAALTGAAIAIPSAGSLVGGILFGHRQFDTMRLASSLTVVAVGTVMASFAPSTPLMWAGLFFSGLGFAPALGALYYLISSTVDARAATEAFGWLQTAALAGGAAGTALGGSLADTRGASGAYLVATVFACLAVAAPVVTRLFGPLEGWQRPPADAVNPVACDR